MEAYQINFEGGGMRHYFTMIPNMVIDDLDYKSLGVYAYFRRVAGEQGQCYKSNKTMCDELGISANTLRKIRDDLEQRNLIRVIHQSDNSDGVINQPTIIQIVNIWGENFSRYTSKSNAPTPPKPQRIGNRLVDEGVQNEQGGAQNLSGGHSKFEDGCAMVEPKEEPFKKNQKISSPSGEGKSTAPESAPPKTEWDATCKDAVYEAIETVFARSGGQNVQLQYLLSGRPEPEKGVSGRARQYWQHRFETPLTPAEIRAFGAWLSAKHGYVDITTFRSAETIAEWVQNFRNDPSHAHYVKAQQPQEYDLALDEPVEMPTSAWMNIGEASV